MILADFIATNDRKYLDYDGLYGAQCVDLIDYYCRDVLDIPIVWANAIDWYGKDATFETWTPNVLGDMTNYPLPGDIVVWRQNFVVGTGVNGHIAINVVANGKKLTSFDQNWPPGSFCHLQDHTYDGIIGWGRKIIAPLQVVDSPGQWEEGVVILLGPNGAQYLLSGNLLTHIPEPSDSAALQASGIKLVTVSQAFMDALVTAPTSGNVSGTFSGKLA